jgi:hypothetical protein
MAVIAALRRFAKLGFWVGLSAGAMLTDACSSGLKGKAQDASPEVPVADAPGLQLKLDAAVKADASSPGIDSGALDADNAPADAGQTDLWDIICE